MQKLSNTEAELKNALFMKKWVFRLSWANQIETVTM